MFAFTTGWCAVFAVAGDVEYGPQLGLQGQSLVDQFFTAGVMFAAIDAREGAGIVDALIQHVGGMKASAHGDS